MRVLVLMVVFSMHVSVLFAPVSGQVIGLLNGDFELDPAVTSPPTGWTVSDGTMYVTSGSGLSPIDPTSAYSGSNFLTANRLAPNPDDAFSQFSNDEHFSERGCYPICVHN